MSSNAMTTGHAALLAVDARGLLAALARGRGAVVRGARRRSGRARPARPGGARRAAARRWWRSGCGSCSAGAPFDPHAPDRLVQDPYPFRVLPQVDGVANDALEVARRRARPRAERAARERPDPRGPRVPDRQLPRRRARGRARRAPGRVRAFGVADRGPGERDARPAHERPGPVPGRATRARTPG